MKLSPLVKAVKHADVGTVRRLLDAGADPNDATAGRPVLWDAASRGSSDIIDVLLRAGAHVDAGIEIGHTALVSAVIGQHAKAVGPLLAAGASPKVRPDRYPLLNWMEWALGRDSSPARRTIVQLLEQAGAKRTHYARLYWTWRARYSWTGLLRRFGIRRQIGPPPFAPPIPVPAPKGR